MSSETRIPGRERSRRPTRPHDGPTGDRPRAASLERGAPIGPWTVVRHIESTASRESYIAERPLDGAGITAIVHLPRGRPADQSSPGPFWRACARVAALAGDGHARILGAGVTPRGEAYIVTALADAEPLISWCDERAVPFDERVELFVRVCDAVGDAHARSIAHGALQPGRIRVGRSGDPMIADLGVEHATARWLGSDPPTASRDVNALGLVLFELLTGTRPDADGERPARVPSRWVHDPETRLRLEGSLDAVLRRALRGEAAGPYSSAGAFGEDLRRYLAGLPVLVDFRPGEVRRTLPVRESGTVRRFW